MVATSEDIRQQHLEEALQRKRKPPQGVEAPRSVGVQYNAALQRLVRMMRRDIEETIMPVVRKNEPAYNLDGLTRDGWADDIIATLQQLKDRWSSPMFRAAAERIAADFVGSVDSQNLKRMRRSFGVDIFSDNAALQEFIQASVYDNTRLITSIAEQYLTNVESLVLTNVRGGRRPSAIVAALRDQYGVTTNRAKMIARDQTAKLNGELAQKRQESAGFEWFQWVTSKDERVRDRHESIAEKVTEYGKGIYRWDNPPLSSRGEPITPGQDFQCRCIARPVSRREVERNQQAGRVRKGVKR